MRIVGLPLGLSVFLFLAVGCSNTKDNPAASKPEVKAEEKVAASFSISTSTDKMIHLQKSALDKEFLLMGEMIQLAPTANFGGIKSRIVAFKKIGTQIAMLEATQGHLITDIYPTSFILAQFPIISESEQEVVFDFNAGMKNIYSEFVWWTSDYNTFDASNSNQATRVQNSFIADIKEVKNNLVIRQTAQIANEKGNLKTVEAKYYITPYSPSAGFKPTVSNGKQKVGYFEVAPQLSDDKTGTPVVLASKFNLDKPIVFALSANLPLELRPAFTEAILYWNRSLGANKVQVIQLEDPKIVAPDAEYNIIQWVEFTGAGAAYADAQPDPRTGEILHAQVYIPSAFYASGKTNMLARVRNYLAKKQSSPSGQNSGSIGKDSQAKGVFGLNTLCGQDFEAGMAEQIMNLALADVSEEVFKKAIHDYLANTVAHEVGHVLGLRHNFAGSLGSNMPRKSLREEFVNYLNNSATNVRDLRPSTSVMEYSTFEERTLLGNIIRNSNADPLLHDRKTVEVLYFGKAADASVPLFCTDSQLAMTDCKRSDSGVSILEDTSLSLKEKLDEYPSRFLIALMSARDSGQDMTEVSFNAKELAKGYLTYRDQTMAMLTNQTTLLSVRKTSSVPAQKLDFIKIAEQQYLENEIKNLGGLSEILAPVAENYAAFAIERLQKILLLPEVAKQLSQGEKEIVLNIAQEFFPQFEKALRELDLKAMALSTLKEATPTVKLTENKNILAELMKLNSARAEKFSMEKTEEFIETPYIKDGGEVLMLKLPVYRNSLAVRAAAVGLLAADLSSTLDYALLERADLKAKLSADMKPLADLELKDATNKGLTAAARTWILENKKILKALE